MNGHGPGPAMEDISDDEMDISDSDEYDEEYFKSNLIASAKTEFCPFQPIYLFPWDEI